MTLTPAFAWNRPRRLAGQNTSGWPPGLARPVRRLAGPHRLRRCCQALRSRFVGPSRARLAARSALSRLGSQGRRTGAHSSQRLSAGS
eukprot:13278026-Alexandrium_andersonii.AAC.1